MIEHEVILASAGSGKTFALTTRLIQLMCLGVAPERILAMTFSRKAAGEIFDTLTCRLAEAAGSAAKAEEMARAVALPGADQARFRQILRLLISRMHLTPIGTLDSFYARVIRAFPLEFGLCGDFRIVDEHELAFRKPELFRRLLLPHRSAAVSPGASAQEMVEESGQSAPPSQDLSGTRAQGPFARQQATRKMFFESFKRATFGREEKRFSDLLAEFTDTCHSAYLAAPSAALWGNAGAIWPSGNAWLGPKIDATAAAADLRRTLEPLALNDKQMGKWESFIALALEGQPVAFSAHSGKDLCIKLLEVMDELRRGQAQITVFRRLDLPPAVCDPALRLLTHFLGSILNARLESTAGLFDILDAYEQTYNQRFRRQGKLTFSDLQLLLARGATRLPNAADQSAREYLDYRLDGFFDHWALDEFQDTSRMQWDAVRNLVDEVIQDPSGQRTFFAVADVKQAIHGWRGGDSGLLGEILRHYNRGGSHIGIRPLAQSWRSCPPVIETVNAVFSPESLSAGGHLPTAVVERWQQHWETHESAPRLAAMAGYAALLEALPPPGKKKAGDEERTALAADLIESIDPIHRGWSAAVLVRSNRTGRRVVESLRARGIDAAWEGDFPIADNPLVAAFLSLLKVAEHPGDTFAREHLLMTPLRQCLPGDNLAAWGSLCRSLLTSLNDKGFEQTIDAWLGKVSAVVELDPFSWKRAEELLAAAQLFDQTDSRSAVEFIDFVGGYAVSDVARDDTVRVMTMHKSKGLGFDIVLLPDLQYGGILSAGELGLAVCRNPDADSIPQWVLSMPPRPIALADRVLRRYIEQQDEAFCFEELCLLYVALTRAKRAVYALVSDSGQHSQATYLSTLLQNTLSDAERGPDPRTSASAQYRVLFETGREDWYASAAPETPGIEAIEPPQKPPCPAGRTPERERLKRIIPSKTEYEPRNAGELFLPIAVQRRDFGNAIHQLFEQIEWLDTASMDERLQSWRRRSQWPAQLAQDALHTFRQAIECPDIREALSRPKDGPAEVWRERDFELVIGKEWISGTFDRVTLVREPRSGTVASATILDFKSGAGRNEEDLRKAVNRYRPQLRLYSKALSRIVGLEESAIRTALLFYDAGKVVEV